ncbi:MAG: thioredoxin domain-containing protein [Endozoicomonadaceae bacterium]|nr:thioredoxin domain-containing protein [Endozoicomonadaceae bacterium]MCY4330523.1 thioredoxin domain-containing protein [Endozoicomonadaceae bacterium]
MIRLLTILTLTLFSFLVMGPLGAHTFSKEEAEQIGEIASEYLVKHPEFLIQASRNLQEKQIKQQHDSYVKRIIGEEEKGKKAENKTLKELLHNPDTPYVGPKDAKVVVIEFFDYQCSYCSKVAPAVEQLIKDNPDIKVIFKDYPIFGSEWSTSDYAANVSTLAFDQGGSDLYHKYHNAIFATGKDEGKLTIEDVNKVAKDLKIRLGKHAKPDKFKGKVELIDSVHKNMSLGNDLGIMGTPFLVVLPAENIDRSNLTVFSGYPANPRAGVKAAVEALQQAVDKAATAYKKKNEDDHDKKHDSEK